LVAEPITETPTLETPVETQQAIEPVVESPPVGDTGQPESVDAAPAVLDDASLDSEYEAYVKTQESKESGEQAPEPAQQREEPEQPQIDPRVYQERQAGYKGAYNDLFSEIRAVHQELVDNGIPESTAARIANAMAQKANTLHAKGLEFHGLEAATQTQRQSDQAWTTHLEASIAKFLPRQQHQPFVQWRDQVAKEKGHVPHEDWMNKAFELRLKHEGYVQKAKYEADKKRSWTDGRRAREQAGEINGAQSGQGVNGAGAGGSRFNTKMEARNLHATGRLSNARMRAINADPSIPEM
jgi:hypothetical protein